MPEKTGMPGAGRDRDLHSQPPENHEPRIGVYVCGCGGNISDTVRCEQVVKILERLPNVISSRNAMFMCSDPGQDLISEDIHDKGVNRVVIGACSIFLHEQTFRRTLARAGLNPYLYYHVGLREQDSWVHHNQPERATEKAIRLMSAGVARARLMEPLEPVRLDAEKRALVIGGGVAGLRAALVLARKGLKVTLVEKSQILGGHLVDLARVFPTGEDARDLLMGLIKQVSAEPRITIHTSAEVIAAQGYVGNFQIRIRQQFSGEKGASTIEFEITVGAVVVATGFRPYEPFLGELGYGEFPEVITLPQLETFLASSPPSDRKFTWNGHPVRSMAMVHCIGSRQVEGLHPPQPDGNINPYCSRVCCTATLNAANQIRERFPGTQVFDIYQDIRTYGRGHEDYYERASKNRVTFLRYFAEEPSTVVQAPKDTDCPLLVQVKDHLTWGEEIELPVDLVVLAVGMMPNPVEDLIEMFKISPGSDRFLLEVHPKLRPVETAVTGIVLAGTAQGPMNIQESCTAAEAAASKVAILLGQGRVELEPYVARINFDRCQGIGECVQVCPQDGALHLESISVNGHKEPRAVVAPSICNGCGVCVSSCHNRAIDIQGWRLDEFEAMVDALTEEFPLEEVAA